MYTVNKTRSKKKLILQILVALLIFFGVIWFVVWFFILRSDGMNSTSFEKAGGNDQAVVAPAMVDFVTNEFKITLPKGWELTKDKNSANNDMYYEFQSRVENYDNRTLSVYVDIVPNDYMLNKILSIKADGNRLITGQMSDECNTFEGAPDSGSIVGSTQTWVANWQGIEFTCKISGGTTIIGTGGVGEGVSVSVTGPEKGVHKYFFEYEDRNIRQQPTILTDAVKSFEAL